MGNILKYGDSKEIAFVGGKPKPDWSGLETPVTVNTEAMQLRDIGPKAESSYKSCVEGLTNRFAQGGNLSIFVKEIAEHLQLTGMDTTAYRPDHGLKTTMVHVVTEYPKLTLEYIRSESKTIHSKWDSYDNNNDKWARTFLLNSLEHSYASQLRELTDTDDTFADLWMLFLSEEISTSVQRFTHIEKEIQAMKISSYSGHNVKAMCLDMQKRCVILDKAGRFDPNLLLDMVNIFHAADGN